MAEDDAGHRLALDVAERLFLDSCEVADLRLRELDVRPLARAHPSVAGIDRGPAQTELVRRPAVEPLRVFAHRRVAARVDRGEHLLDGAADLHVRLGLGVFADPGLEVAGHGILLRLKCAHHSPSGDSWPDTPDTRWTIRRVKPESHARCCGDLPNGKT